MNAHWRAKAHLNLCTAGLVVSSLLPVSAAAKSSSGAEAEIRVLRAELERTRAETQAELRVLRNKLAATRSEAKLESQQNAQHIQETKKETQ